MKNRLLLATIVLTALLGFAPQALASFITPAPGAGGTGPQTIVGSLTVQNIIATSSAATSSIANLEGVYDAGSFTGADMGAKINAAYAACPTNGCQINVPGGVYSYSTPIVIGTANKPARIVGTGGTGFYAAGGTTLVYTGSTGNAFTYNVANYSSAGIGLYNLSMVGHAGVAGIGASVAANVTSASTDVCINLGGANGATGFTLQGVNVSGCGVGVSLGNNIFLLNIDGSAIQKNGVNIQSLAASGAIGENNRVTNSLIADSNTSNGASISNYCVYVQDSGNVQWSFTNNSIDDCQLFSTQSGGTANIWKLTGNHFEDPNVSAVSYPFFAGLSNQPAVVVDSTNNDYMNDHTTGMTPEDILNGGTFNSANDTVEINNNVPWGIQRFIVNQDSTNVDNVSWTGLTQAFANTSATSAVQFIYGTAPFPTSGSTQGVGSGQDNGVPLVATQFAGADIGAQVNAAYATAVAAGRKGITIEIPNGKYSFSTPIVCGTDGTRCLIVGNPAEGVELDYTGTGAAITLNDGIQGVGIDHTSGQGLQGLYLKGNNYSTTTPQIGVLVGGTNGNDGAVINSVNIFHFGYGIQVTSNAYHILFENSTVRDNGQNVHINAASNSGESLDWQNMFIVDGANKDPIDCIWLDNSASASFNYTGGSFDDCQMHILQANNVTITGTHVENPGSKTGGWSAYTPIVIDQNLATNVDINGVTFFDTSANGFVPPNYISNGGNVTLDGVIVRQFSGSTMTNFAALTGSGRISWIGLNDVSGTAFTNVVSGIPYTTNGTTGGSTLDGALNLPTLSDGCLGLTSSLAGSTGAACVTLAGANNWTGIQTFSTSPVIGTQSNGINYGAGNVWAYASSTNQVTTLGLFAGGNAATTSPTVSQSTFIGYQSGDLNSGGLNNSALGYRTIFRDTSGSQDTAIGNSAMLNLTTGNQDSALGYNTLINIGSGSNNVGVGAFAGNNITTGGQNIAIGAYAASSTQTGSGNITIGYDISGPQAANNGSNILDIGNLIYGTGMTSQASSTPAGNVGIATSTPWALLTVGSQASNVTPLFVLASSTAATAFEVTAAGHVIASTTNPVLSSCGTTPTMKGDDTHGEITVGSSATGCTLTFQQAYSNAPECTITNQSMSVVNAMTYTISNSAFTISMTGAGGDKIDYQCEGMLGPN